MGKIIKIATFQMDIAWENKKSNWENIILSSEGIETDILVLPEMFLSGFSADPQRVAIFETDTIISELKNLSSKINAAICGSLVLEKNENYYNRMYFIKPNGEIESYDKRHLFRMAGEDKKYTSGSSNKIVEFRGFKFCLQVCYDLRFPIWSRNSNDLSTMYDCLIYVANWPKVRSDAWYSLLKARAIENWSYCVGVNRVGSDGNKLEYDGRSEVFDFKGIPLTNHINHRQGIEITTISKLELDKYREVFPAYLDVDN